MQFIDTADIQNKRVLLRVDYNISLNPDHSVANDERIKQSIPTLQKLLSGNNKLILVTHLGEPKGRDENFSVKPVVADLQKYLPDHNVVLKDLDVILSEAKNLKDPSAKPQDDNKEIVMLENIRFFAGETTNDPAFAKQLASLADVYVNDAFAVCHRKHASVVGISEHLPHYGGLLLQKEIMMITKTIENPQKPFVAILGGAKISTKIKLIGKLIEIADHVLLAGGLAHNFLLAQGMEIGKSIAEPGELEHTKMLLSKAREKRTTIELPVDCVVDSGETKAANRLSSEDQIMDIGPETEAHFGHYIADASTIVWNGPVGKFEDLKFRHGTDFIYYAITENRQAISVVGGGDTLAAMTNKEHVEKITHISTGGGAMLEFIENGTLPGIEALK